MLCNAVTIAITTQELVRTLRSLHQLVVEAIKAAHALDNEHLQQKLTATAAAVERGLPFAPSLFTAGRDEKTENL